MNNEKLTIDVELNLKGLKQDVKKVQTELKKADSGTNGGLGKTKKQMEGVSKESEQFKKQLETIKHLSVFQILEDNAEHFHNTLKRAKNTVSAVTFALKEIGKDLKPDFKLFGDDFKLHFKEEIETMKDYFSGFFDVQKGNGFKGLFTNVKDTFKAWKEDRTPWKDSLPKIDLDLIKGKADLMVQFLNGGILNIKENFKKLGAKITETTGLSTAALGSIAVLVADLIVVVKSVQNAIKVAQETAILARAAESIGLTTDSYKKYGYVLESVGIETDRLRDFMKTLTEQQNAVREGSEDMTQAFAKLGISAEKVKNMNQADMFITTIKALQNVEDQNDKTALSYKLLGEDAMYATPLLNLSNQQMDQIIHNYKILGGPVSDNLINSSVKMTQAQNDLKLAWGGFKNALAEGVLPAVISVIKWLSKAMAVITAFTRAVFGISDATDSSSGSFTTGMDGYTDSVNSATKAVEKLRRAQMGFDELNVLPGVDTSSSSTGIDANVGGFGGAYGELANLKLPTAEDLGIDDTIAKIEEYKGVIQTVVPAVMMIAGLVMGFACLLGGNIPGAIAGFSLFGMGDFIASTDGGLWDQLGEALVNWWYDTIVPWFKEKVQPKFTKEFWKQKWEEIKQGCKDGWEETIANTKAKWQETKDWFSAHVAKYFTKEYWNQKLDPIKQSTSEKLEETKRKCSENWQSVKDWFSAHVGRYFTKDYWRTKFDSIRSAADEKLNSAKTTITGTWDKVKNWFDTTVKPKFTRDYWAQKFDSIKQGAKASMNGVIEVVERGINWVVRKLNLISWQVPDWVPEIGGRRFGIHMNEVYIPRLATGGIATRSTIANIGENGKEAILPLERNTGWMDTLARKIGGGPTKLYLQVDGQTLGWVTIDNINQITKQTGEIPLAI